MGKYYRKRSEATRLESHVRPEELEIALEPVELTYEESEVYQKMRSDKLIKLKDIKKLLGVRDNTLPVAFLLSMDVPVYRVGQQRGTYYVFSSDVVKAFTRLRLPAGLKFKRRLLNLAGYRDFIQSGSLSPRRANGRGDQERSEPDQEEVLPESGAGDGSDSGPRPKGRKRGRTAKGLQQDLGRTLGSWKAKLDAARLGADLERDPHGPGSDHRGEGGEEH